MLLMTEESESHSRENKLYVVHAVEVTAKELECIPNFLVYGFYSIDVCAQSPVVIQYQSATPVRQEPVDGTFIINCDLYNRVLGYGKAQGVFTITPSLNDPGKFHLVICNAFAFEQN